MMNESDSQNQKINLVSAHLAGGYNSAFETESEADYPLASTTKKNDPLFKAYPPAQLTSSKATSEVFREEASKEAGRARRFHFLSLDAYSRHKKLINEYFLYHKGATAFFQRDTSKDKTDYDVLKEHHQFLWEDDDEADCWEKRLAKKYYDRLFKEYCITDLCHYKEGKIAMRWRTEQEVINGRGQFSCGNKKCQETENLRSWEVNFAYEEHGEKKNALVKLRLCPDCSFKLNYRHQKKEVTRKNKRKSTLENNTSPSSKKQKGSSDTENMEEEAAPQKEVDKNVASQGDSSEHWKEAPSNPDEKSQEEEFEDYLADMLL